VQALVLAAVVTLQTSWPAMQHRSHCGEAWWEDQVGNS
jgi:hypothetical protein